LNNSDFKKLYLANVICLYHLEVADEGQEIQVGDIGNRDQDEIDGGEAIKVGTIDLGDKDDK
jgi:hypothetical protein